MLEEATRIISCEQSPLPSQLNSPTPPAHLSHPKSSRPPARPLTRLLVPSQTQTSIGNPSITALQPSSPGNKTKSLLFLENPPLSLSPIIINRNHDPRPADHLPRPPRLLRTLNPPSSSPPSKYHRFKLTKAFLQLYLALFLELIPLPAVIQEQIVPVVRHPPIPKTAL